MLLETADDQFSKILNLILSPQQKMQRSVCIERLVFSEVTLQRYEARKINALFIVFSSRYNRAGLLIITDDLKTSEGES